MRPDVVRRPGRRALALQVSLWLVVAGCKALEGPPAGATGVDTEGHAVPVTAPAVTALGRLEPKNGIIRVAGPSRSSPVIAQLMIEEGDHVQAAQPIAVLDALGTDEAQVARARAELANSETELARQTELLRQGIASVSLRDAAQLRVDVAKAELKGVQAALDLDTVYAPVNGQVIKIHARRGERVGPDGIAEMAENDQMYAVAEVYETDIARVKVGQRATMRSPALDPALTGTVERVGMKVGKLDVLNTDPAARTDARVVEVRIKLDDSARGAALSNLQVEVAIETR